MATIFSRATKCQERARCRIYVRCVTHVRVAGDVAKGRKHGEGVDHVQGGGERRQKVCSERASEKAVALAAQGERNREGATRTRGNAVFGKG